MATDSSGLSWSTGAKNILTDYRGKNLAVRLENVRSSEPFTVLSVPHPHLNLWSAAEENIKETITATENADIDRRNTRKGYISSRISVFQV
jgi:predicted Zn-dependent protease with MMP-like domain